MTDAAPKPPARAKAKAKPEVIDVEVDEDDGWRELEFHGDTLKVRPPTQQALAAFSLGTSKHVPAQVRNDITGLFVSRSLHPDSYERVFSRLMDPDDLDYDTETIGLLMRAVIEQG
jgi:hypothetical protein